MSDTGSILTEIKKRLGIDESYTQFDPDIILSINTAFSILYQLGIGPDEGFSISDASTTWEDYTTDINILGLVKDCITLRVRLLFDPPTASVITNVIQQQLAELEWRLNFLVDPVYSRADSGESK